MSTNEMDSKVKELRELRRMADELAAEIEAIQDQIKGHMGRPGRGHHHRHRLESNLEGRHQQPN